LNVFYEEFLVRLKAVSRRENLKTYNRTQILRTAQELFSTHGFHDVSMHLIAEESGFSIGTLYNFFKDKEELYSVLVKDNFLAFHRELVQALDSPGDEVERIRAYVSAKGRIFQNNRSMMRLYFAETHRNSFDIKSGLNVELRAIYEDFIVRLAAVFESGVKRGLFRPLMEPYYLAVALASLTNAFLILWLEDPVKHPYSQNVETIMRVTFENIIIFPDEKKKLKKRTGGKK
jgi:TetR/AcrR family transcriptional regulator